jgi:hypothetical protein
MDLGIEKFFFCCCCIVVDEFDPIPLPLRIADSRVKLIIHIMMYHRQQTYPRRS